MERIALLGEGLDHASFLVDDHVVLRFPLRVDAAARRAEAEREALLLELVAEVSPVPVPRPRFGGAEAGCLAYELLDGVPLLDLPPATRTSRAESVGRELGRLLAALHCVEHADVAGLVEADDVAMEELLREAREHYAAVSRHLPARHRPRVEDFLSRDPPEPAAALVLSHNDLGIEHVLVDPNSGSVSGVIDWSDAALTDPARDLGLVLRDLGHEALEAARSAEAGGSDATDTSLGRRVVFHARCALLEDLAFGLESDRHRYTEKSLAGLAWLFT